MAANPYNWHIVKQCQIPPPDRPCATTFPLLGCLLLWLLTPWYLGAQPHKVGISPDSTSPDIGLRNFVVTRWSTDSGLPSNTLTGVIQSRQGYIWISSYNGLIRFDGNTFQLFDRQSIVDLAGPGSQINIANSGFYDLVEDQSSLWLGAQNFGVLSYRAGRFHSFAGADELKRSVRRLMLDQQGRLWVGTADHGAYRYEIRFSDPRLVKIDHPSLQEVTVRDIIQGRDGAIWFATEGKGLTRFKDGVYTTYTTDSGLVTNIVHCLWEASDGGLWIGSAEGLSRLQGGTISIIPELAGIEIFRLYEDDYDNLWIGAEQGLFRRYGQKDGQKDGQKYSPGGYFEHLREVQGERIRQINDMVFDHEGSLWLSSYGGGLLQLKAGKFINYTRAEGIATQRVNTIYEAAADEYWVGTDDGIIHRLKGGQVSTLEIRTRLPEVRIRDIHRDRQGNTWISSHAGLLKIDDRGERLYTTEDGLSSNLVRFTYEDRRGNIWVGTRTGGLMRMGKDGVAAIYDHAAGLASNFVFSAEENLAGEMFIGTRQGLSVLGSDGTITNYTREHGLLGSVFHARVDEVGAVWMATDVGLSRLYRGEIKTITVSEGLPAESIFDYQEDDYGSAWLSSAVGVIRIPKEQLNDFMNGKIPKIETTVFDDKDGMSSRDCTGAAAFLKASDGRLWFPTLGGVAVIDPDTIPINEAAPPVAIHRFTVDTFTIDTFTIDTEGVDLDDFIEIEPGKRRFVFEFAALSFLAPSKAKVMYRLEGFEEAWSEASPERKAYYTNLGWGEYTFKVMAANNDGVWNEEGAALKFRIKPFFYETSAFYVLASLLLMLALLGIYTWRVRVVERRSAELESVSSERERLIKKLESKNEEMERFTYTVSHDLKSPLFTISGFLGMAQKAAEAGKIDRMKKDIARIHAAANHMRRLLDEVLKLSQIGRRNNTLVKVQLSQLARQAVELVSGSIAERGVEVEVATNLPVVVGDFTRLLEVFQNLIENAIKFMGEEPAPRVEIGIRYDGEEAVCYVRDNGIGIEPDFHDTIFGLFDQLDKKGQGSGAGLAIVKRVVEVHGGRIWVESEGRGRGSAFCFTLLLDGLAVSDGTDSGVF